MILLSSRATLAAAFTRAVVHHAGSLLRTELRAENLKQSMPPHPGAGYDNSAPQQRGLVLWDKDPKYPAQTLAVVAEMAKHFSSYPALLGFNLLDSPVVCRRSTTMPRVYAHPSASVQMRHRMLLPCYAAAVVGEHQYHLDTRGNVARQHALSGSQVGTATLGAYYLAGYNAVRAECLQCIVTITPPAWQQDAAERYFMGPGYNNVYLDLHRCCRPVLIHFQHDNMQSVRPH